MAIDEIIKQNKRINNNFKKIIKHLKYLKNIKTIFCMCVCVCVCVCIYIYIYKLNKMDLYCVECLTITNKNTDIKLKYDIHRNK